MLVLKLKHAEQIVITKDGKVIGTITLERISKDGVRLGFHIPDEVKLVKEIKD